MAILHLIYRSPTESSAYSQCLARAGQGDALLLLENGVYAVASVAMGKSTEADLRVFVLSSDLRVRGLSETDLPKGMAPVDYDGFVELTEHYPLSLSWF